MGRRKKFLGRAAWLDYVERDGTKFWFLELGDRGHEIPQGRVYLSGKLLKYFEEELPKKVPAHIDVTSKGTLVLKPSENTEVFFLYAVNGYRGYARFTDVPEDSYCLFYQTLDSPLGSLGEGQLLVIELPKARNKDIVIKYERTGRYVTTNIASIIISPDGDVWEFDGDAEELDGLENLE